MLKTNTYRARKKNKIKVFNQEIKSSLGNIRGKRMHRISSFCKKRKPEKKKLDLSAEMGIKDFSDGASGKEPTCQCKRHWFNPWIGRIPWRSKCQPAPVFLPGKSHGQRSWARAT